MQQQDEHDLRSSAGTSLYHHYAPIIFAYIGQRAVSREDAEDLTLEVFIAALEQNNLQSLPDPEKLAWLRRVAHNKLVDRYRHLIRHPSVTWEDAMVQNGSGVVWASPEHTVLQQEANESLYKALAGLSEVQRQVLRLRYGNELSIAEMAIMLNKREGAVRKQLARALTALQRMYDQVQEGKG